MDDKKLKKRCWELLPMPLPSEYDPGPEFFYKNIIHPLEADAIGMMCTGLYVDYDAVEELRTTIDVVLESVDTRLLRNPIIQKLQEARAAVAQKVHYAKSTEAVRPAEYYLKKFAPKDMEHRTWVVNSYLKSKDCEKDVKEKWSLKDLKSYNVFKNDSFLGSIIEKKVDSECDHVKSAMMSLAEYKAELWNRPRYQKGAEKAHLEPFNPGSAKQLQELFSMLKVEPLAVSSKTGAASWGRDQVEMVMRSTPKTSKDLIEVLTCIIDHSFGGIIRSNFLKAFDTYTLDGVLHGNIKVMGAKSARPTSNEPNLLNFPSTKSIYAKPLKRCFVAPDNMLVIQCDFASLEDVVLSDLTLDEGKLAVQRDKTLDAHCYNALGYFQEEVEHEIGSEGDFKDKVRRFKLAVDGKSKILSAIRQKSKPITFKLAYLGFPDDHKGGAITQSVYDNYHNVLYPGVKSYLEDYIKPVVNEKGYLHLGLGCRLYSDDVDSDFRTLFNASFQFWSILTVIAINELNYRIKREGLQDKIKICSSIYDSIYAYITPEPDVIKWYNDNVYEIGRKDFIPNQQVPNTLTCDIGRNWAEEVPLPVGASIEEIGAVLEKLS